MKRNVALNHYRQIFRKVIVYTIKPLLAVSFLFCQLSFQTNVPSHIHSDRLQAAVDLSRPAGITPPLQLPETEIMAQPTIEPGKRLQQRNPGRIKNVGQRSAEIYRIML